MARRDLLGDDKGVPVDDNPEVALKDTRIALRGVTIGWLGAVFRMDHATVKRKLADCPETQKGRGNTPMFDIAQAAGYLIKPKVDIKSWVKSLRPADLPPYLQSEFWEAQNKRQKYEENAGDLWRTDRVVDVFADTFKTIKDTMNLWVDSVERSSAVTGEQRKMIMQLVDGLQNELHKKLIAMGDESITRSSAEELEDIEAESQKAQDNKHKRVRVEE